MTQAFTCNNRTLKFVEYFWSKYDYELRPCYCAYKS